RARSWQDASGGGDEARAGGARRVQAPRPSLVDPARPLHLQGGETSLQPLPDQRSVPLARQDGVGIPRPALRACTFPGFRGDSLSSRAITSSPTDYGRASDALMAPSGLATAAALR